MFKYWKVREHLYVGKGQTVTDFTYRILVNRVLTASAKRSIMLHALELKWKLFNK